MNLQTLELKQRHINASTLPDVLRGRDIVGFFGGVYNHRQFIKICDDNCNFVIYADRITNYCYSVAKENSGCNTTCFGGLDHVKKLYKQNHFKYKHFTKYGRRLLGIN